MGSNNATILAYAQPILSVKGDYFNVDSVLYCCY